MNELIKSSEQAMTSVRSVLLKANIDTTSMTTDEMIDKSRSITAPCRHDFDRAYKGEGTRICTNCGSLQTN